MNDQLQSILLSILQSSVDTAGQIKDLLVEETPQVVQQLLMWKMTESLVWFCFSFIGILAWYIVFLPNMIEGRKKESLSYFNFPAWCVFGGIGSSLWLIVCIYNFNIVWLQILIAPKVYLIEYIAELSKGVM